jgi:hypothetical protein
MVDPVYKRVIWSTSFQTISESRVIVTSLSILSEKCLHMSNPLSSSNSDLLIDSAILPAWTGDAGEDLGHQKRYKRRGILSRWVVKETDPEKAGLLPRAFATAIRAWDGSIPVCHNIISHRRGVHTHKQAGWTSRPDTLQRKSRYHRSCCKPRLVSRLRQRKQGWIHTSEFRKSNKVSGLDPSGCWYQILTTCCRIAHENIRQQLGPDAPPTSGMPDLPVLPLDHKTSRPGFDSSFSQSRVSLVFSPSTTTGSADGPFTTNIALTLLAAPSWRISAVVFRVIFADGVILALSPTSRKSESTEVQYTNTNGGEVGANVGTAAALPAQAGVSASFSRSNEQLFQRRTWSRIQGSGVGFKTAEWVFEEDPGEAGRHGVSDRTTEPLSIDTSVRPALIEYEIDVTVVEGEGKESRWLNTKKHKSGQQRIILP